MAQLASLEYPGHKVVPFTTELGVTVPDESFSVPALQLLTEDGSVREGATLPDLSDDEVREMYTYMVRLQTLDSIFNDAQRQGRISFYMQAAGEEGIHMGSAKALGDDDMVFAQYREAGILMWRGFSLEQFSDQCFSNEGDTGKGRQMPIHYGSRALNYVTISSPLATQIPQATGAAYAYKMEGTGDKCVICYFGEGAASEGDFHAALNFAATLEVPCLFFCRNNGFAISTPVREQLRGDGIISRAAGYGMASIRVDGNDLLAVYEGTRVAREYAIANNKPVLIEAMTYRQGHHSTSDDSTRYRSADEIKMWQDDYHPIRRVHNYMVEAGMWSDEQETELRAAERKAVMAALATGEAKPKPPNSELFSDVYLEKTQALIEQEAELHAHMAKYPDSYLAEGH